MSRVKFGVIGTRTFKDEKYLFDVLNRIQKGEDLRRTLGTHIVLLSHPSRKIKKRSIKKVISGGALGSDSFSINYAKKKKIPFKEYKPDWDTHGKAAGFIRNTTIAEKSTILVAFWDGKSNGTRDTIKKVTKMIEQGKHKQIWIVNY